MVFTPFDFAFRANGIEAKTTPNNEMILIVDCAIDLLRELHQFGALRNLKDRIKDLFELKIKGKGLDWFSQALYRKHPQ